MSKTVYEILVELEGASLARQGLTDLANAAGMATNALAGFFLDAGKAAASYETAIAKVSILSPEVAANTGEFSERLRELAGDLKNSATSTELAAASAEAAGAGYSSIADNIAVVGKAQQLAAAGSTDAITSIDGLTTALNVYGDSLGENLTIEQQSAIIADQLFATYNLGKISIAELSSLYGNLAPTAKAAGVAQEEMLGAIALLTSNGLKAGVAFSSLRMAISNSLAPSQMARDEAERLGISFDEATLKSMGLANFLNYVAEATGGSAESLTRLFGSVEAVNAVIGLTGENTARFTEMIEGVGNSAGQAEAGFNTMSETIEAKATRLFNVLRETITSLGSNIIVAIEPAINALTWLAEKFAELPEPIKQMIGVSVLVNGAMLLVTATILKTAASFASFAASIPSTVAMLKQMSAALPVMVQGLSGIATGMKSAAGATGLLNASLLPIIGTIGLVVAAVGSLALAWKQYENIRIEQKNEELMNSLQETEPLVRQFERLGNQMRSTGEAIPEDEFNQLIALAKEAQGETGNLEGHIAALTRMQEKARNGIDQLGSAQDEQSNSARSSAAANEEATESLDDYIARTNEAIAAIEAKAQAENTEVDAKLANGDISEEQAISERINNLNEAANQANRIRREQLQADGVSAEQRKQLETNYAQAVATQSLELANLKKQLRELEIREEEARFARLTAMVNAQVAERTRDETEGALLVNAIRQDQIQSEIARIQEEYAKAEEGTAAKAELEAQYWTLRAEYAELGNANEERLLQESLARLSEEQDARQANLESELQAIELRNQLAQGTTNYLSGMSGLLSDIDGLLANENTSAATRNQLIATANSMYTELSGLGIQIAQSEDARINIARTQAAITQAQIQAKIQEVQLQREQLELDMQLRALTQQALIEENRLRLESGTLSENEARVAQTRIQQAERSLQLLQQEAQLRSRNLDLTEQMLNFESQVERLQATAAEESIVQDRQQRQQEAQQAAERESEQARQEAQRQSESQQRASQSGRSRDSGDRSSSGQSAPPRPEPQTSQAPSSSAAQSQPQTASGAQVTGTDYSAVLGEIQLNAQSVSEKLALTNDNLATVANTVNSGLAGISPVLGEVASATNASTAAVTGISTGIVTVNATLTQTYEAMQTINSNLGSAVGQITAAISALPNQIAANMPRPTA